LQQYRPALLIRAMHYRFRRSEPFAAEATVPAHRLPGWQQQVGQPVSVEVDVV
jgi:hypothetical protein